MVGHFIVTILGSSKSTVLYWNKLDSDCEAERKADFFRTWLSRNSRAATCSPLVPLLFQISGLVAKMCFNFVQTEGRFFWRGEVKKFSKCFVMKECDMCVFLVSGINTYKI